jgi:uncharacterized membrane protein YuzA (DUF378 family)
MEVMLVPLVVGSQNYVLIALCAMYRCCSLGQFCLKWKKTMSKAKYMKFGLVQDVKMPADFV